MGSGWEKLDGGAENWRPAGGHVLPAGEGEKWIPLYPRTQHLLDRPFKYTEQTTTTAHAGGTYFFRDAFSWLAEPLTGSDGT